jgi:hypothetical protein
MPQRDDRLPLAVSWQAPGRQRVVDVRVEVEEPAVDQPEHGQRSDRFADRTSLKPRRVRHRAIPRGDLNADSAGMRNLAIIDQRPAHSRNAEPGAQLFEARLQLLNHGRSV